MPVHRGVKLPGTAGNCGNFFLDQKKGELWLLKAIFYHQIRGQPGSYADSAAVGMELFPDHIPVGIDELE